MCDLKCYRCATWPCECADGCAIVWGDCREVLPISVDVVVTDPPYGIEDKPFVTNGPYGRRSDNTWHAPSDWDKEFPSFAGELVRQSAPVVAWFGHWRKRHLAEESVGMPIRCEIVWVKNTHVGPPCPAAMRDERIWVFSLSGLNPRRFETTVWDEPVIPSFSRKRHKNEKPIGLMRRLVDWLPGETILDPFMGSGTTLVAAKQLGRRAIGIEIEEKYCEIAANRLANEPMPLIKEEVGA